jgi:hypothetical protein
MNASNSRQYLIAVHPFMTTSNRHSIKTFAKLLLAGILIAGLIVVAAQDLVPHMSYTKLFAYIFIGLAALAANLVGLSVIYLNVYEWVLRKGGTDTAWFWFNTEPKGLMAVRERLNKD